MSTKENVILFKIKKNVSMLLLKTIHWKNDLCPLIKNS